ncbi:MAG: GNAT family N-acetyltransferase [Candidatus Eisenbacteria bacterium]|uniref:GNAT family N-acetyltransferase n=1 Tax=Eiseniibacteriota bacterium TaxID=2212470 RepID=A0A956NCI1_UNCEI|nr:GNAT family N-acetyltransferase [Candidatus Eisenbacteria bacterium]
MNGMEVSMTTGITVSVCTSVEEVVEALSPISHYFGNQPTVENADRFVKVLPVDRMHLARDGERAVGGAGAFPFEMTTPGGMVPAAGVTVVGVLPTDRRRGILSQLMRAQLDDIHARKEPVAYLWASEETIYGRYGYGLASWALEAEIPKPGAFARPAESVSRLEMVSEEDALSLFPQVYDRVRPSHPGMFSRTEDWWRNRRLADPPERRGGGGVLNRVLLRIDGEPMGYATYRVHQNLDAGVTKGRVSVIEALGASPEATRDLWRFLLDIDWVARVKVGLLALDHPLLHLLARPRTANLKMIDALWVRLVDVEVALRARTYGAGGGATPVVFEVVDPFCPRNDGRYQVGPDGARRTDAAPDLRLDVSGLGAAYLGQTKFESLRSVRLVEELSEGAIRRADALFAADRAPWCPEIF